MKNNLLRVVKMTAYYSFLGFILQVFFVNVIMAGSVEGQNLKNIKVSVNAANVTLEQAFKIIERESKLTFGYDSDEIPKDARVTLKLENESLQTVLEGLARDYNLVFNRINNHIVVRKAKEQAEETIIAEETGSIQGKITDAKTGEPLIGANIMLKGTTTGVATNINGTFTLNDVLLGEHIIVVKYVGYATKEKKVTVFANQITECIFFLEPSLLDLDEVVVTGSIIETQKRAVPVSVGVITLDEIQNLQIKNVSELFRGETIPGIISLNNGQYEGGPLLVRGKQTISEFYQDQIKTYVDGIEVSSPNLVDINSIERIELVKGPQASTIYGTNASGGVIQIFTKKGNIGRTQLNVSISGGVSQSKYVDKSPYQQDYDIAVSGGVEGFSYNIGGSYFSRDPFIPEAYHKQSGFFGSVKASQGQFNLSLFGGITKWNSGFGNEPSYKILSTGPEYPRYEDLYQSGQNFGMNINFVPTSWWQHNFSIGLDNLNVNNKTKPRFTVSSDSLYGFTTQTFQILSFKYNTFFDFDISDALNSTIVAGFEYSTSENGVVIANGIENASEKTVFANNVILKLDQTIKNYGFLSQWVLGIYNSFFLTTGIRLENNDAFGDEFGSAISPRVGSSYVLDLEGIILKPRISYGKAIKQIDPAFKIGNPIYGVLANDNIGPESQKGFDAGIDFYTDDGLLKIEGTYYKQKVENLVDLIITDFSTFEMQFQNVGEIINKGFELAATLNLQPFQLSGTFTSSKSTVEKLSKTYSGSYKKGDKLIGVPENTAGANITYFFSNLFDSNSDLNGNIQFGFTYIGKTLYIDWIEQELSYINGTFQDPRDYWRVYPSLITYRMGINHQLSEGINASFNVDNLFNKQDAEADRTGARSGRTFTLTLKFKI